LWVLYKSWSIPQVLNPTIIFFINKINK